MLAPYSFLSITGLRFWLLTTGEVRATDASFWTRPIANRDENRFGIVCRRATISRRVTSSIRLESELLAAASEDTWQWPHWHFTRRSLLSEWRYLAFQIWCDMWKRNYSNRAPRKFICKRSAIP